MKKTLFFCILLIALKVYTQTVPVNEVSLDQMLVNINKTTVTSGIIYERVAPFANLYNFNTNTNRNIADFKFFKHVNLLKVKPAKVNFSRFFYGRNYTRRIRWNY